MRAYEGIDRVRERGGFVLHAVTDSVGRALPSSEMRRANPSLLELRVMWEEPYMTEAGRSALQVELAGAIARAEHSRDYYDGLLKKKLGTSGKPLWDIERGKTKRPGPTTLRAIEQVLGYQPDYLVDLVHPRDPQATVAAARRETSDNPPSRSIGAGETGAVVKLDLRLPMGPGATVDDYVEEEPLEFDLAYIRSFSRTPLHRLRIAEGVGDSMFPTLLSADLVWIDTTQNQLLHSDRIYAASINGGAAIKRLRPIDGGKRVLIISDNKTVDSYEVDAKDVAIWGRVIRFTRDL